MTLIDEYGDTGVMQDSCQSSFRQALAVFYPLAGHAANCTKVLTAASTGNLIGRCSCGWELTTTAQEPK